MLRRNLQVVMVFAMVVGPVVAEESVTPYHVMVTNDDGIDAPGITAIVAVLAADPSYRVTVVAPAEQQSVTSHSHVTRREVPVRPRAPMAGTPAWSVGGTPASVVRIGLTALLADDMPDLVVSGINRGENNGLGAWTSGTVGAAREAILVGVSSIALSLQLDWDDPQPDFKTAARWCKPILDAVRKDGLPDGVFLNVNVPRDTLAIKGYRLARMGLTPPAVARFDLVREEDGTTWYRSRWRPAPTAEAGTDTRAMLDGWVAIAPLGLDQTDFVSFPMIQGLEEAAVPVAVAVGVP